MKTNSKAKGDVTEGAVLAKLLWLGLPVLVPFGDNQRYDLAVDFNDRLIRVQCKTGCLRNGSVVFQTRSSDARGRAQAYHGQADVFGVYCRSLEKVYFLKVKDCGSSDTRLRVHPPRKRSILVREASLYEAWPDDV